MFLGTDANKTVFWIEQTGAEVVANLDRAPQNLFFYIKPTPAGLILKPVTVAESPTDKTISRKEIRADGNLLN